MKRHVHSRLKTPLSRGSHVRGHATSGSECHTPTHKSVMNTDRIRYTYAPPADHFHPLWYIFVGVAGIVNGLADVWGFRGCVALVLQHIVIFDELSTH